MHVSHLLHNSSAVHRSAKQMQPALTLVPTCCSYDHSALKQSNQRQLEKFLQTDGRAISKRTLQQLQTKRSTTTGFFRAMWILFKYRGRADFTDPAFLVSGAIPS